MDILLDSEVFFNLKEFFARLLSNIFRIQLLCFTGPYSIMWGRHSMTVLNTFNLENFDNCSR